jgi:hypothetical protein
MSEIADIAGIWIADQQTPTGKCGCLVDDEHQKQNSSLKQFIMKNNADFKLICWLKGKMEGKRIFIKGEITKKFETGSASPLDMFFHDIDATNKTALHPFIWIWPKAANWKIPGEYAAMISLGHVEGNNLSGPKTWETPIKFSFEVINK